jgi:HAD superfamily hydrolase (TIGR01456 family)
MAVFQSAISADSAIKPPIMSAFEEIDLLPILLTRSKATCDQFHKALGHNVHHAHRLSNSLSSIPIAESGRELGPFESPASRSPSRSPYFNGTRYENRLSPRTQNDFRAALNSFAASLPTACRWWKSRLSSVAAQDHDLVSSIHLPLPVPQQSPKMASSQIEQSSKPIIAAKNMAFAFDIDGVLVHGDRLIPEARRALQILNGDNSLGIKIPHIFLTNGGGKVETDRCAHLTEILDTGTAVTVNQIIQSHTPMQALKGLFSTVLIVGGEGHKCKSIAQSYGFTDVIVPYDIVAWDPTIAPFKKLTPDELAAASPRDFSKINIDAILVFSSSRDYGTDLQIIMDVLRSSHGRLGTVASDPVSERVPIFFSHGDLVFPNQHFQPRLSQGTFRIALEAMYKTLTGVDLERVVYGKPETEAYTYAEGVLASYMEDLYGEEPKLPENVYMVGDNPASDICGGNKHGWKTCLVRTGVFQGAENDEEHPASFGVFDDVLHAVTAAVEKELGDEIKF